MNHGTLPQPDSPSSAGAGAPVWTVADSRTGRPVTITSYPSHASAERQIERWRQRDAKGGRPDLHDTLPYLVPYQRRGGEG